MQTAQSVINKIPTANQSYCDIRFRYRIGGLHIGLGFAAGQKQGLLLTIALTGKLNSKEDLYATLIEGAALRVRPKAMIVAVILAGLIPILVGTGTGSEAMSRIAAPMIGGMLTAPLLSLFVLPAAYMLLRRKYAKT